MTSITTLDKKDSPDPIALAAKLFIKKLKVHIERDNCQHCREVLSADLENKKGRRQPLRSLQK
jgi:hypothetical protein